jgi:multidrug efflux pump subunit AcrA (membrane-fusion protein)
MSGGAFSPHLFSIQTFFNKSKTLPGKTLCVIDKPPEKDYTFTMTFPSIVLRSAVSLMLLALTGGLIWWMTIPEAIPQVAESGASVITVEVVPIQQHETGIDFPVDGEVIPFRRLDLVAEIQGRVVYKSEKCRLGQFVEKDELLLEIDPVDYQLALDHAETAVSQAKVIITENEVQKTNLEKELTLAQEQLEISKQEYERNLQLAETRTVPRSDLEMAQSALLTAQKVIQQIENQVRVLNTQVERLRVVLRREELALETAGLNLSRTKVKAPIAGIITADTFEVNSFIQKGANVARILDTTQLEIQCSLHMKQIQWVWRQSDESQHRASTGYVFAPTPVTVLYETDGERWVWEGELISLDGGIMNPITRMVPCRIKVNNPQSGKYLAGTPSLQTAADNLADPPATPQAPLIAGMFVTVIVHSKPAIPLYRIPERALLPGNKIWTVVDGKLRSHSIRIATTTSEGILFYAGSADNDSKGVRPNDLVVVSPLASPSEGTPVQTIRQ